MVSPLKKLQLGKNGLTPEFIEQVRTAFKNTTFMKVEILSSACRDKEKAKQIGDGLVEGLGKNFTYKLIGYVLNVKKWRQARR